MSTNPGSSVKKSALKDYRLKAGRIESRLKSPEEPGERTVAGSYFDAGHKCPAKVRARQTESPRRVKAETRAKVKLAESLPPGKAVESDPAMDLKLWN